MIFYIVFLLFISSLLLMQYFCPFKQRILEIIVLGIIVLISGLRKSVGYDYNNYVLWYLYKVRDQDFEFGFVAIMNLFRYFDLPPFFLFFFFSFFTYLFVYLGIKKYTSNSNLALLFFIMIPGLYLTSFTILRQFFSVAICFYSFSFLINKKYIQYFLLMFIGLSIHNSCLIPFILFLIVFRYGNQIKINYLYGIMFFSFLFSSLGFFHFFHFFFDKSRYLYYFSNQNELVNIWKIIVLNFEGILILYYFKINKYTYSYQHYLVVLYSFSIVFLNLFSNNADLTRIAIYFRIFEIIIVSDLIFSQANNNRKILFSFFYTLYFLSFLNALKKDLEFEDVNMSKLIPYNNILLSSSKSNTTEGYEITRYSYIWVSEFYS
ncbi:MAG: EpsG family protein [Flavobacterium sp.]